MSFDNIAFDIVIAGVTSAALFIYLLFALLFPERI